MKMTGSVERISKMNISKFILFFLLSVITPYLCSEPTKDQLGYKLALSHFLGVGKPLNHAKALESFQAIKDYRDASFFIGYANYWGLGTEPNKIEAYRYLSNYLEGTHPNKNFVSECCYILATIYRTGSGTAQDHNRALELIEQCKLDTENYFYADGRYLYSIELLEANVLKRNRKLAFNIHIRGSEAGHIPSLMHLISAKRSFETNSALNNYTTRVYSRPVWSGFSADAVLFNRRSEMINHGYVIPLQANILDRISAEDRAFQSEKLLDFLKKGYLGTSKTAIKIADAAIKNLERDYSSLGVITNKLVTEYENDNLVQAAAYNDLRTAIHRTEPMYPEELSDIYESKTPDIRRRFIELLSEYQNYVESKSYDKDGVRKIPNEYFLKKLSGTFVHN